MRCTRTVVTKMYDKIIDAETWAFIKETERFYPAETLNASIDEQRRIYDRMCQAFDQGYPDGVIATDQPMNGIATRTYTVTNPATPIDTTVVYFHGGGFVVGGLESHDDVCADICGRTGFRVISVDYRLAPEHKHPAMFNDAQTATMAILASFDGAVILCGDSAGGNLAAAVAHALRNRVGRILGQVLIYPALGGDTTRGSYVKHANAPMLGRDDMEFYTRMRVEGVPPLTDPQFAPLQDTSFADLPATMVITAECDPLSDDGRDYCMAIQAAGGRAVWVNEPGLVHGFLRARTTAQRAKASFDRVITALTTLQTTSGSLSG